MLYLHCGWPRTGTTSLQAALFEHRERLADTGIEYPERWLSKGLTHHGISELLRESLDSAAPLDDFKRYLTEHADRDVLFSVEALSFWLLSEEQQQALLEFFAAIGEVVPLRCIWTLRRFDELLLSLHLRQLGSGVTPSQPVGDRGDVGAPHGLFAGMRGVDDALGDDVVYVKYNPSGAHNDELLRAFGLDDGVVAPIRDTLGRKRRSASLTQKQAIALLNLEALSARIGVAMDKRSLREAVDRGELRFDDDRLCVLMDDRIKQRAHEQALRAAREQGFTPYVEFFADAEIASSTPVSLDLDLLTDDDVERLAEAAGRS
jgi:hypothetical protein